jgi:hypothetical protein
MPAALAHAAVPHNDSFEAAEILSGESGAVHGSNVDSSRERGEPSHGEDAGGYTVWYRWTAPVSATVLFETCGGATFDTMLAAYTGGALTALSRIAANDDACRAAGQGIGEQSRVALAASAGTTYSIALDGYEGEQGSFTLRWRIVAPPANEQFATAQELSGASGSVTGDNHAAQPEPGEPGPGDQKSLWYRWPAPITGAVGFETCGSSFDTVLAAFTGSSLDQLTAVAANDDACGTQSRIRFPTRAGTVYNLQLFGVDGRSGEFRLSWAAGARPANDAYDAARVLRGERGSVTGSNVGALSQEREPRRAGSRAGASLWYRWRAPRTMGIAFSTCRDATFDTVIAVYEGSSLRRAVRVDWSDNACEERSRAIFVAEKGTEYRIALDGSAGASGRFTLAWNRPGPFNEPCRVPDLRGLSLPAARIRLNRANCTVGRVTSARSSLVAPGRVIAQRPAPDARLRIAASVDLEVSRGR